MGLVMAVILTGTTFFLLFDIRRRLKDCVLSREFSLRLLVTLEVWRAITPCGICWTNSAHYTGADTNELFNGQQLGGKMFNSN